MAKSQDTSHDTASASAEHPKAGDTPPEATENDPRGLEALGRVLKGLGMGNLDKVAYINTRKD